MAGGKVRHVDYYPDEYISGVGGVLRADEQGVYWMACSLIISHGGPVPFDERRLANLCLIRPGEVRRIVKILIDAGKLTMTNDGELSQKRAENELEKSAKRIQTFAENGANGGRPSKKTEENQQNAEPGGFSGEKLTSNQQPSTSNQEKKESTSLRSSAKSQFDDFWDRYPNKVGKAAAVKAFAGASNRVDFETMMVGLDRYVHKTDDRQWCNPSTWLNQDRWADQPASVAPRQQGGSGKKPSMAQLNHDLLTRMREAENVRHTESIGSDFPADGNLPSLRGRG